MGKIKVICNCNRKPRLRLLFKIGPITENPSKSVVPTPQYRGPKTGRTFVMTTITDSQKVPYALTFTDKKNNPAPAPAGTISWLVDNPNVIALTPAADNMSCDAAAVGPLGTATVSVKVVDAQGNTIAAGSDDLTVISNAATQAVLTPGTPVEQ